MKEEITNQQYCSNCGSQITLKIHNGKPVIYEQVVEFDINEVEYEPVKNIQELAISTYKQELLEKIGKYTKSFIDRRDFELGFKDVEYIQYLKIREKISNDIKSLIEKDKV